MSTPSDQFAKLQEESNYHRLDHITTEFAVLTFSTIAARVRNRKPRIRRKVDGKRRESVRNVDPVLVRSKIKESKRNTKWKNKGRQQSQEMGESPQLLWRKSPSPR